MTDDIKTIEPLTLTPIIDDPTLVTVKVIKAKIVDQIQTFSTIPDCDPRVPNVKIVGRIENRLILFRMFKDDPTNNYLGKISFVDYIIQLAGQILAATDSEFDPSTAESARKQAAAYITDKIPELFTS